MAQNTFKTRPNAGRPRARRTGRVQHLLEQTIGLDRLFTSADAWFLRNLDRILWVSLLLALLVGSSLNAERQVRLIQRTRAEVDELRAQSTTLLADFMRSGKQSELSKRVLADSLTDSQTPPYKIVVKTQEE